MVQKEDEERAPPKDPSAADLLTAQDIFGEVLESLGETYAAPPQETAPSSERRSPIKVQVSEPGAAEKPALSTGADDVLPEELANLLDAFDPEEPPPEPPVTDVNLAPDADVAPAPQAAAPAPEVPEPPPSALNEALESEPPAPEPPPPPVVASVDEPDEEVLDSVLPPGADDGEPDLQPSLEAPSGPRARAPHRRRKRPGFTPEEALRDLQNLRPPFLPPRPSSGPIDLASLVEQALGSPQGAKGPSAPEPIVDGTYGPYRLLQKIAVGGMAEVFKAKRSGVEGFEKVVAVKRILPHLSDNKEFVEMFIDEAKMVAGLAHPNIVQISDLGKIDKSYYIAMEYVHGRDLRTILRRAKERGLRLPLDLTVLIVSKVCSALEFAHRKKDERARPMLIVHRDISPQNILISFEGEVKLTDFGIAKAATKARITDAGALRGKLLYMSPEQAWGKPMDRRSDVFSLGIVFYEMITDQKPFLGSSEMSILEMVRECRIAPPSDVNPRIPERLEKVVMTALDRDPEHRYQDASQMYRELDRVLHERQPPTAVELSRFLELLFDEGERTEARPEEHPEPSPQHSVDIDFGEGGAGAPDGPPAAAGEGQDPGGIKDPLSIQKLLKRFGIK
ncbi:MAG TPA: protein kinase [Vicinamibacteria bacterium]|nr:protein kinase [Vicinamibacteria bacterium]